MLARLGIVAAVVVTLGMAALAGGERVAAQTPEKFVTIDPTSGPPGTVVHAELFNGLPNDNITVVFKIPGDPILATGTTDASGHASFTFTIPPVVGGGSQVIFFTNFKCSCQISVPFEVINVRPTPTPTSTPTVPRPTSTPVTPPPTQTALPTATPTPTRTPAPPVLGTAPIDGGGGGPNAGVLGLGFLGVVAVLAWFAATRRGVQPQLAVARPIDSGPDYSTELDMETLESMRRPFSTSARPPAQRGSFAWAAGAGLGVLAGVFLLRRR
jgi:hypothetical protein